jgi:Domain of unknown function (DUF4288)
MHFKDVFQHSKQNKMNWYLAKIVYRIISGDGKHTPQFDEQLRLINADDDLHAFQKARLIGDKQQDSFLNKVNNTVRWKFIDVAEINKLENLTDGAEMYSRIYEEENAELYIRATHSRAKFLLEKGLDQFVPIN